MALDDKDPDYLLLLICHQCKSIEEIPYVKHGKYLGDGKWDQSENPFIEPIAAPHASKDHRGTLMDIPLIGWVHPNRPEIREKTLEEIKKQVLGGGSSGLDVFGTNFYDLKDTYSADAMSCYSIHNRPKGQCPDYKSDRKILKPGTAGERKAEGLAESKVKIHLCDFCPVKMHNQQKAYQAKGLYE
jgi:hypothetical protein